MDPSNIPKVIGDAAEGAHKGLEQAGSDIGHHLDEAGKAAGGAAGAAGEGVANLELDKKAADAGEAIGSGLEKAGHDIGHAVEEGGYHS